MKENCLIFNAMASLVCICFWPRKGVFKNPFFSKVVLNGKNKHILYMEMYDLRENN